MNTNKIKNLQHQQNLRKIRSKQPDYDWSSLEAVIRLWVRARLVGQTSNQA
jgi:hypothetical protein